MIRYLVLLYSDHSSQVLNLLMKTVTDNPDAKFDIFKTDAHGHTLIDGNARVCVYAYMYAYVYAYVCTHVSGVRSCIYVWRRVCRSATAWFRGGSRIALGLHVVAQSTNAAAKPQAAARYVEQQVRLCANINLTHIHAYAHSYARHNPKPKPNPILPEPNLKPNSNRDLSLHCN